LTGKVHGDNNDRGFTLRGMATAKIDKWGRIRIPSDFLKTCKEECADEVFIASTDDGTLDIYPLAAWLARVDKLLKEKKDDPLLRRFLLKAHYNGQVVRVDGFGRVRIPGLLRKKIRLEGVLTLEEGEGYLELTPASK
jgi:DNA-binding transcriptional regulator/RsmH inhibitor MraZ